MRALITGASGFAGGWLARACAEAGDEVTAVSRQELDLRDADGVRAAVRGCQPEIVYHLAALSSVAVSWEDPARVLDENVAAAVNVLEAIRLEASGARVVWVSSCEVYGVPETLPIPESAPMAPANPYAVSKAAAEMLAVVYANAHGLEVVRARPFSHSGPGQRPAFLLSSLARQAAEARRAGVERVTIVTGNPDTRRDFTDVRDMVRAYRLLASPDVPVGLYNVSSGMSVSAGDQVRLLTELLSPVEVVHEVDPARVRASEVMDLRGDHTLLTSVTGWEPEIPLRRTMQDTIDWWEREL